MNLAPVAFRALKFLRDKLPSIAALRIAFAAGGLFSIAAVWLLVAWLRAGFTLFGVGQS